MFWSKNKKKVYPCKPQFYYIKVGCKEVFVTRTCFRDVVNELQKQKMVLSQTCLNIFIACIKQGVGPQVFPTLVTALPLQYTYSMILNSDMYSLFMTVRI